MAQRHGVYAQRRGVYARARRDARCVLAMRVIDISGAPAPLMMALLMSALQQI